jgi:hypothetical protein
MKTFFLRVLELLGRFIAWSGAGTFEIRAVREITSNNTTSTISEVCLWILVVATIATGIIDLWRFGDKIILRYTTRNDRGATEKT